MKGYLEFDSLEEMTTVLDAILKAHADGAVDAIKMEMTKKPAAIAIKPKAETPKAEATEAETPKAEATEAEVSEADLRPVILAYGKKFGKPALKDFLAQFDGASTIGKIPESRRAEALEKAKAELEV
jgi:hypothetical protein